MHDRTRKAETVTGDDEKNLQIINCESGESPNDGGTEKYGKLRG